MKSCLTLLQPLRLWPSKLLCLWDFPGKHTGVGCHFLLQGIFPIQGWNPCLLHWQADSVPLSHQGSPIIMFIKIKYCYCSVAKPCLTPCDPMDYSTPGLPVPHHLPEFIQVHAHWIGDAIQPAHPWLPSSPFVFPSIRVFSNESALCIRWPKYWSWMNGP